MLSQKQLDTLLYELSSFYRDFLPPDNSLIKLFDIYAHTIDYTWNAFGEANDSSSITTTRTLKTLPYYKIDVSEIQYSLDTARILTRLNTEEQIDFLNKEGKYASFEFHRQDTSGEPIVYSMMLYLSFDKKTRLVLYKDYIIRSNRLYLLPSFIQKRERNINYLHAFDIKLNDRTLEKNFGTRFSLEVEPLIPRFEYRDVLEAFIRSSQGDMTIKEAEENIALATKWDSFKIEDINSPGISLRKKELYEQWKVSPNKFMLTLPEFLIPDKVKLNIVKTMLDQIKEVQTDYLVFFDILRKDSFMHNDFKRQIISMNLQDRTMASDVDRLAIGLRAESFLFDYHSMFDSQLYYDLQSAYHDDKYKHDFFSFNNKLVEEDTFKEIDDFVPPKIWLGTKEVFHLGNEIYPRYDDNLYYDDDIEYDMIDNNSFDSGAAFDTPKLHQTDRFSINERDFPEIPRSFTFTETETEIIFECRPNYDGTTKFELLASDEINGTYTVVEEKNNNESADKIVFNHNAKEVGKRYYYSRAVVGNSTSLMTLPIDLEIVSS